MSGHEQNEKLKHMKLVAMETATQTIEGLIVAGMYVTLTSHFIRNGLIITSGRSKSVNFVIC